MRKFLLIIMILAAASSASAKFRFGPVVGANFSDYHWSQHLFTTAMRPGFSAGLIGEVMIPGIGFGFDFGLKYANRGGECDFSQQYVWSSDGIGNTNLRIHTIQIPVNLRFKWTRMDGFENYLAPFIFAGPQFNINAATSKCPAVDNNGFAVGIEVCLGVELFKRFQLSAGYVWDVTDDVHTKKLDDFNARIQGWLVDFAVLF